MNRWLTSHLIDHVARFVLAVIFLFYGFNYFLGWLPWPDMPLEALMFLDALQKVGYLFPVVFSIQLLGGVLLLLNRFVPLAIVMLAPIVVNIVLFYGFLNPGDRYMAVLLAVLLIILTNHHRQAFAGVLKFK